MREKGFALAVLIGIIAVVFILTAAEVFVLREFQKNNRPQETLFEPEKPAANQEDIYNTGFYLNRDLQFSFNYPTSWFLGEKVIDREGNLNTLTFYLEDPQSSRSSQLKILAISVTKGDSENISDIALQVPSLKKEMKKIGELNGDFYSLGRSSHWTVFVATLNNLKYGFLATFDEKEEYLVKFEELISTVKVNDARASSLPKYFRDNLALDKRVSQPLYIPSQFSIIYEKQSSNHQEWNYSIGVWERGSGPNDLNIYVQRVGIKDDLSLRQFTVNLENLLEEKSIHKPGVGKGVAKVEPIEVKGFRGYFINIGESLDNSRGSLIFATDIVTVSIDYRSEPDSVFSKEELLKIAESMIHI